MMNLASSAGCLALVFFGAVLSGGPKLDTKAKVKVKGSSVEYSKYDPDHREENLLIRRKARRKMVNAQAMIFEEHTTVAPAGSLMLLQYTYEGVSGEKRLPLDKHTEIRWRDSDGKKQAKKPLKPTFETVIEGFQESCIWSFTLDDYLDITDAGRFTIKTSRKKFTVRLSKDDKEAMRWAVWNWYKNGDVLLLLRYGKKYR